MKRYHMQKGDWMIEGVNRAILVDARRKNPRYFKHARIREVLQLLPSQVRLYRVYSVFNQGKRHDHTTLPSSP